VWKKRKTIKATVQVSDVQGSTIVGYQEGLDEAAMQQMFDQGFAKVREWLEQTQHAAELDKSAALLTALERPKPLALSLYVCKSGDKAKALGFAINNSGLVVATASIGSVTSAVNVANGEEIVASTTRTGSLLQLIKLPTSTVPVIPAYLTAWGSPFDSESASQAFAQTLFAFDESGTRQTLSVNLIDATLMVYGVSPSHPNRRVRLDGLVGCEQDTETPLLIGGPVFTAHDEVCGILIARTSSANQVWFAPWANVDIEGLTTAKVHATARWTRG
jgi:hypothetical protein